MEQIHQFDFELTPSGAMYSIVMVLGTDETEPHKAQVLIDDGHNEWRKDFTTKYHPEPDMELSALSQVEATFKFLRERLEDTDRSPLLLGYLLNQMIFYRNT